LYISGWVTAGSSCSLWPSRRKHDDVDARRPCWKRAAVVQRELRCTNTHGLGIVAVHVEDRRLDHLGHVRCSTSVERVSRGSDVVKPIWLLTTMWTVPPVR
jgi:hypothetical protein